LDYVEPSKKSIYTKFFTPSNHAEAINDIADYMVGFYNNIRLHSTLGNLSPNAFKRESISKKSIKLAEIT